MGREKDYSGDDLEISLEMETIKESEPPMGEYRAAE